MKKYIVFLIFIVFACSSNKQLQFDKSNCNFNDKISENEKLLDIKPYVKGKGGWTIIDNNSLEISVAKFSDDYWLTTHDKKTSFKKIIEYDKKTLKIKSLRFCFEKGNFNIGNEYIYNEQGQVIKTIDHNQYNKYPICYKEIIENTIKKAGKKFYFQGLERDSLINNNKTEYSWKVYFEDSISKFPGLGHKFFRIEAKTGKTITEKIIN